MNSYQQLTKYRKRRKMLKRIYTKLNWCCFVSQTGSEVYDICTQLGVVPKLLVTNNPRKLRDDVAQFLKDNGCEMRCIPFRPSLEHYLQEDILNSNIITLHGYLRILPGEFIQKYSPKKIYNGHPALVNYYPELKGFNQQEAIYNRREQYKWIGSIIHEVTEGVDEGKIYYSCARKNSVTELSDMYDKLKETSLDTWIKFFKYEVVQNLQNNYYTEPESLHWVYGEEPRRAV